MDNMEILVYIAVTIPVIGVIMAVKLKHLREKKPDGKIQQ
jgi:hypothetical protein